MAKKNDYILIEEIGDAFRHSGQNPTEDIIKDMVEKGRVSLFLTIKSKIFIKGFVKKSQIFCS